MAVVRVIEVPPNRSGDKQKTEARFTRVFRVITDNSADGPNTVLTAAGIPLLGSPYVFGNEVFPGALAQTISPQHVEKLPDGDGWEVTVGYSDKFDLGSGGPGEQEPTNFTAEVSWSVRPRSLVILKDAVIGQAITNSAGDPFDPPLEREVSNPVLRVERWEAAFDPQRIKQFAYKVNDRAFLFADTRQAMLREYGGQRQFVKGKLLWKVTYEVEFLLEPQGWNIPLLDRGFRKLVQDADGTKRLVAIMEDGTPLAEPAPLDGVGGRLAQGGEPIYLFYNYYAEADFTQLNLENI